MVLSPKHPKCRPGPKNRMGPALAGLARARERKAAAAAAAAEAGGFGESAGPQAAQAAPETGPISIAGEAAAAEGAPRASPARVADAAAPGSQARPPTPMSVGGDATPSPPATEAPELHTRLSSASAADGLSGPGGAGANGSGAGGSTAMDGAEESMDVCVSGAPAQANGSVEDLAATADTALCLGLGLFRPDGSSAAPMELECVDTVAGQPAGPPAGSGHAAARMGGAARSDSGGRASDGHTEGHRSNAPDASAPPTSMTDGVHGFITCASSDTFLHEALLDVPCVAGLHSGTVC